jgi:hypothetical protein
MNKLYNTIDSEFSQDIRGMRVKLLMFQPTPKGLAVLCAHYSKKYTIDLRCINLERHPELVRGDNLLENFKYFKTHYSDLFALKEGQSRGIILCYQQNHVVPVLITQEDNKVYMVVFDSSSGARIKGYFPIAECFPETDFFLNTGTRQADGASCFTDAVCILKEALQIDGIIPLIKTKVDREHKSLRTNPASCFRSTPLPSNFNLFRMPEKLLLTAQRSDYIKEAQANLDVVLRDGRTLEWHRAHYRIRVGLTEGSKDSFLGIHSYLTAKAEEHKGVLDKYQSTQRQATSPGFQPIEEDLIDRDGLGTANLTSPAPASQDRRPSTQPASGFLLDSLAVITPIAGLLVAISLITENYPMANAFSLIAITGFFGARLASKMTERVIDELDTNLSL